MIYVEGLSENKVNFSLISICKYHYFHIDHNAPCLPPPPPPRKKKCITVVFNFSLDDCVTQEKLETIVMQNFGE